MSLDRAPLEHDAIAPSWSDPIAMFIAWIAHLFDQITKLKRVRRTSRFKANWRSHWPSLRRVEWLRDQILADCATRLLAGGTLDDASDFIPSTEPPADYGGPCPATPFEMNRRFLAIARFNADPERVILKHVRRIAKRAGMDLTNPLAAHGSTDAQFHCAAHHEAGFRGEGRTLLRLMASSAPCARPSNHEGQQRAPPGARDRARGPPTSPLKPNHPPPRPRLRERTRLPAAQISAPQGAEAT